MTFGWTKFEIIRFQYFSGLGKKKMFQSRKAQSCFFFPTPAVVDGCKNGAQNDASVLDFSGKVCCCKFVTGVFLVRDGKRGPRHFQCRMLDRDRLPH